MCQCVAHVHTCQNIFLTNAVANNDYVDAGVFMLLQVVASMRDDFELHGQGAFEPAQEHSQQDAVFFTDQMTVEPLAKDSLERQAWRSTWQDAGWLQHNPLVSKWLRLWGCLARSTFCFGLILDQISLKTFGIQNLPGDPAGI